VTVRQVRAGARAHRPALPPPTNPTPPRRPPSGVIFEWDGYFHSYLAIGMDDPSGVGIDIALANLAVVSLGRSWDGQVLNYLQPPFHGSYDRSEPPVGAQVLLRVARKWPVQTLPFVELLLDPLLGWSNWTWSRRRCGGSLAPAGEPSDLICLGSDAHTTPPGDGSQGTASLGKTTGPSTP